MWRLRRQVAAAALAAAAFVLGLWWLNSRVALLAGALVAIAVGAVFWIRHAESERNRHERDLHLGLILDQMPAMVWSVDADERLTMIRGNTVPGAEADQLVGLSLADALPGDSRVLEAHREALAGRASGYQYQRDGRHFDVRMEPLRGPGGRIEGAIGCAVDVTRHVVAEDGLREAQTRYQALVEELPAVTYIESLTGPPSADYISPQFERLLGQPPLEWKSSRRRWLAFVHPDDRGYVAGAYRHTRQTSAAFSAEYRCLTREGRLVWLHHSARVVTDPEGRPAYIQGVMLDISARKLAEQALRDSELRYRTLVEASPDAITVVDLAGQILMTNSRSDLLHGDGQRGPAGRHLLEFVAEPDREAVVKAARQVLEEGGVAVVNHTALGPEGRRTPVELCLAAIRDGDRPLAMVGVARDISERVAAAQALRENEEKSRFLATMSHELRTPLNSILGFAQLMASGDFGQLSDRQRRYLGHIEGSGRHLLELVDQLLDLSRAASGGLAVSLEPVRVARLLEEAVDRGRPVGDQKFITLTAAAEPRLCAEADRRRTGQVLDNLIGNALKFTPPGGLVELEAYAEGEQAVITVTDNGIGIPPEQHELIFQEFFQVDSGPSEGREGSGLGLSLSRRLVELMGGSLTVESAAGEGSTFIVRLPIASYDEAGVQTAEVPAANGRYRPEPEEAPRAG